MRGGPKMYHLEYAFYKEGKLRHHAELTTSNPRSDLNSFLSENRMLPLYTWSATKQFKDDKGVQLENPSYSDSRLIVIIHEMVPADPMVVLE